MAGVSPLIRPIGIFASAITVIQGIVWLVLALLALLIYEQAWEPNVTTKTYGQSLTIAILALYFDDTVVNNVVYIAPVQFFIWIILYLIISIIWTAISACLFWSLMGKKYDLLKKILLAWSIWTIIVCICDLILASLLASDYNTWVGFVNEKPSRITVGMTFVILACGTIMTLAARGFVLWIVNLTFAGILIKFSVELPDKLTANDFNANTINAYGQTNTPRQGFNNPAYNTWEANRPDFARSDSFVSGRPPGPPEHLSKLPPIASTNERLAKIGRPGAKTPPQIVAPPKPPQNYIYPTLPRVPSPDYSPPNSPMQAPLKSALKNRTQNVYGYSNNRY